MKTIKMAAAGFVTAALLAACGGNDPKPQATATSLDLYSLENCYWADKTEGAPAWTCNQIPADDKFVLFAVGKARTSKYDQSLSRNKAMADAQALLQQQIETKVEKGLKESTVTTGALGSDDETLDTASKQVLNVLVKGTLNNTRVIKELPGPDGYTYVLMGVAKDGFADIVTASVKSSLGNKKAQYQMFVAEKIQKEFDAEFDQYQKQN